MTRLNEQPANPEDRISIPVPPRISTPHLRALLLAAMMAGACVEESTDTSIDSDPTDTVPEPGSDEALALQSVTDCNPNMDTNDMEGLVTVQLLNSDYELVDAADELGLGAQKGAQGASHVGFNIFLTGVFNAPSATIKNIPGKVWLEDPETGEILAGDAEPVYQYFFPINTDGVAPGTLFGTSLEADRFAVAIFKDRGAGPYEVAQTLLDTGTPVDMRVDLQACGTTLSANYSGLTIDRFETPQEP